MPEIVNKQSGEIISFDDIQTINFCNGLFSSITLWQEYNENPNFKRTCFKVIDAADIEIKNIEKIIHILKNTI